MLGGEISDTETIQDNLIELGKSHEVNPTGQIPKAMEANLDAELSVSLLRNVTYSPVKLQLFVTNRRMVFSMADRGEPIERKPIGYKPIGRRLQQ